MNDWLSECSGKLAEHCERGARSCSVHGFDLAGDHFRRLGIDAVNANTKRLRDNLFDGSAGRIADRYPQITHRLGRFGDRIVGEDERKI
jgi:hypothetical protein